MEDKTEILMSKLPFQFQHGWFGSNPSIEWEKALEAMDEYANLKVKNMAEALVKLRQIYLIDIDTDGEIKESIQNVLDTWGDVNKMIEEYNSTKK